MWKMIWDWVSKAAELLSIISFIPFIVSTILLIREKRRVERTIKKIKKCPGTKNGVLSVTIGDKGSIKPAVYGYIRQQPELKDINEDSIYEVDYSKWINNENDLDAFIKLFRKKRKEMMNDGVNVIHLFCMIPIMAAVSIGAELSNGCPVIMYQNNRTYTKWGQMDRFH